MHWAWFRFAAAIVALTGVIAGLIVNIDRATRQGQDLALVLANYFSLFTIISSILSVIALTAAGSWMMRHPGTSPVPRGIAVGLASVTGPVILLGIVYNVLLRGVPSEIAASDPPLIHVFDSWATESLHVVMPLYFLLDLLFARRVRGLKWSALAVIAGYPLLWIAYTMVRGEMVSNPEGTHPWWYPYPFLDPHGAGGYGSAFAYIGAIFVAFILLGLGIIAIGRHRERRAAARTGETTPMGAVPV